TDQVGQRLRLALQNAADFVAYPLQPVRRVAKAEGDQKPFDYAALQSGPNVGLKLPEVRSVHAVAYRPEKLEEHGRLAVRNLHHDSVELGSETTHRLLTEGYEPARFQRAQRCLVCDGLGLGKTLAGKHHLHARKSLPCTLQSVRSNCRFLRNDY